VPLRVFSARPGSVPTETRITSNVLGKSDGGVNPFASVSLLLVYAPGVWHGRAARACEYFLTGGGPLVHLVRIRRRLQRIDVKRQRVKRFIRQTGRNLTLLVGQNPMRAEIADVAVSSPAPRSA
jgi:hypothetical protein